MKTNDIEKILQRAKRDLEDYALRKNIFSIALIILEECLFLYQNISNDIKVKVIRNEKELYIEIKAVGEKYTPYELEKKNEIFILDNIIKNTNFIIDYRYDKEINFIKINIEKYLPLIENIKFVFKYINKNNGHLIRGYVSNTIACVVSLFIPTFTGKVIVNYTTNQFEQTIYMCVVLLIVRVLYATFFSFASIDYNKVSFYLFATLRKELMEKLFTVSDDVIEKDGPGPFMTRINDDALKISEKIAGFFNIVSNMIYYTGVFFASLLLDFNVFLIEIISFSILFYLEKKRIYQFDIERRKAIAEEDLSAGVILDIINGLSDIKILNAIPFFNKKVENSTKNVADKNIVAKINSIKRTRINQIFIYFCYTVIMIYIGYSIKISKITIPTAIILFNYFTIIGEPLVLLIQNFLDVKKDFSLSCERAISLIKGNEFSKEINGEIKLDKCEGMIEFENVSFYYKDYTGTERNVLNNLSFKIEKNQTVAFVGKSGSGKSTILKIITAQRNCQDGIVKIDNIDIQKIDKVSLRDNVMMINQNSSFFNTSIKENLLIAKPDATIDELKVVCEKACILDDILNTKDGFDTIINEKGARFSGGQRQRLAIARALLRNTKIIVFDEAMSAIDSVTQEKIIKNIINLEKEHTVIIVTHKLDSIQNVDQIFVIGDRRILGHGKHKELLDNCKEYKNLYKKNNNVLTMNI